MSDYLTNLLIRTWYPERTIQPRVSTMFDPGSSVTMRGAVSGWESGEELYQPAPVNPTVPRDGLSEPQSSEVLEQDREDGGPLLERETQQQERGLESTAGFERWDASEPRDVAVEATPVLGQVRTQARDDRGIPSRHPVVPLAETSRSQPGHGSAPEIAVRRDNLTTLVAPTSRDSEQHGAISSNPSEDNAGGFSPIDHSIVTGSSPRMSLGPDQEETASRSKFTAQSASPTLQVRSGEINRSSRGETSLLTGEPSSEPPDNPSVTPIAQNPDRVLNSRTNERAVRVSASSSRHPLAGASTTRGDGDYERRFLTTVKEPEGALQQARKEVVSEKSSVREVSLDPSLVAPVSATKVSGKPRHHTSGDPGDSPEVAASMASRQEQMASSLVVPMASKKFLAVRRSLSPMRGASVGQVSATDRGKPTEPVVQVTIGRVEVRAVAPPARQEKGRKPPSAMSLDDYLKRRGGRSGG